MQIQKTTDYKIFKGVLGNRAIFKPHVRELELSIQERDLLQFNPIMVTKDMQVIDGQHRLEVAKRLNRPIYYVIMEDGGMDEIRRLQLQRQWKTEDYLNSFIALNNHNYSALQEFAKEYHLSIPVALMIASNDYTHKRKVLQAFRRGDFVFVDRAKAEAFASFLNEVKKACTDGAWKDREFLIALNRIMPKIDQKKLETYSLGLTRRRTIRDYIRQFTDVYNFRQHAQNYTNLE